MPLLVSTVTAPPPVVGEQVVTPIFDTRPARYSWVDPTGVEWMLDVPSQGWVTPRGRAGLGAAPVGMVTDPHPRGGARVRHIQPQPRTITLPVDVWGQSPLEFTQRWRDLMRAFTMTRRLGPGIFRKMLPDGEVREIRAYYDGGFDGQPGRGHVSDTAVVSLFCEDPFWSGTAVVSAPYTNGAAVSYLNPYLTVSPSSVLGATTATNPGDVEAWPQWQITGPASAVTATNNTTGQSFTLTGALTAGQTATITTDPPTVRGPAGENWTGNLNWPGAVLWALEPGVNDVTFSVTGATAATSITLSYTPRYESA